MCVTNDSFAPSPLICSSVCYTLRNESAGKIAGGLNRMFALKTGFSMPRLVQHLLYIDSWL